MSKVCQITGKKVITGNNVSHSNRKTKRTFKPNLQIKRFYVPEWDEWVVLKVSAAGLRTIDKKGVYQAIMDASTQLRPECVIGALLTNVIKRVVTNRRLFF